MIAKKTTTRRGLVLCGIFFISILIVTGCTKTATDVGEEKRERFTGGGAWSVNGIQVGQALSVVEAARGKPNKPEVVATPPVYAWPDGVTVGMDERNQVKTVYGNTLKIGAADVVNGGITVAQTQQILGEGKEKVFRSPKGSGVISTGYVASGKSLTYARDGAYFVFTFNKNDQLSGVSMQENDPNKVR